MTSVRLTPAAQADLSRIWDFTVTRWGERQAETYIGTIRDTALDLAHGRKPGQAAEYIRAGYRKQYVGSHVLFYRAVEQGGIEIVRILHERMDAPAHLGTGDRGH